MKVCNFSQVVVIIVGVLVLPLSGHFVPKIKENVFTQIKSYINQAKEVQIPFKKCFQVST